MRLIQSKLRFFISVAFMAMVVTFPSCSPEVSRIHSHVAPNGVDTLEIEVRQKEMILLTRTDGVIPISKELRISIDPEQSAAINAEKYTVTWGNKKVRLDASSVNLSVELSTR